MDGSARAEIVIAGEGDAPTLTVDGLAVDVPAGQDPMLVGIALVATTARPGHPVPAVVVADDGNWRWRVLVHADGTTSDDPGDTGGWRPERRSRRPSRLAVAAIGVMLVGGGVAAVAVTSAGSGRGPDVAAGSVGGVPATTAPTPTAAAPTTVAPLTSVAPPTTVAPPTAAFATPAPAPRLVPPAAAPEPVAGIVRAPRPVVTTTPVPAPAPVRRTTEAPASPAPAGRLVALSDGAGQCATAGGATVSTGACSGSAAQKWTATAAGELRQGSNCLVTRSGVAVVDCASVPAAARTWTPTSPAPGLVNPATSLCLGASGSTVVAAQCGTGRSLRIA